MNEIDKKNDEAFKLYSEIYEIILESNLTINEVFEIIDIIKLDYKKIINGLIKLN